MQTGTVEDKVVIFVVGHEEYAVMISAVKEVISWSKPVPIPEAPPIVEGVIDLRGDVIPVVDLAKRFGTIRLKEDVDTRIMIMDVVGRQVGFVVDDVTEVHTVTLGTLVPPSPLLRHKHSDPLVSGILKVGQNRLVAMVDANRILAEGIFID